MAATAEAGSQERSAGYRLMIGQKLGSFRIESKLGAGAMGVVYRAVSEASGRVAAVKVLSSETKSATASARFKREAEILQGFRHPNIVRFMAVGRYQGTSYFAMEFVPGKTLDQVLDQRGALPWPEVVELGLQICDALHYAHERGVIHRDLKPSNLMLMADGRLKLTDFGIAKDLDATTALTAPDRTLGTAAYMAPEQIRGHPEISHKTDLYALGILLYQMLVGEPPFQGRAATVLMQKHLNEPAPAPAEKNPEIPVVLNNLVLSLMAKEPRDRPWDAAAVGLILTELKAQHARGEPIELVRPPGLLPQRLGGPSHTSTTLGSSSLDGSKTKAGQTKTKISKRKSIWKRLGLPSPSVESALLVVALIAILGFMGYMLWPPSNDYLMRKAGELMASDRSIDWSLAQTKYLNTLDRKLPADAPEREQLQAWQDQIGLHRARGRADVLERPNLGALSRPSTDAEHMFREFYVLTEDAVQEHRERDAARLWREMADLILEHHPEERAWALLARERAEAAEAVVARRRDSLQRQLERAEDALLNGRLNEVRRIRREILDRYDGFPDLADLVAKARELWPVDEPDASEPEPSDDEPPDEPESPDRPDSGALRS